MNALSVLNKGLNVDYCVYLEIVGVYEGLLAFVCDPSLGLTKEFILSSVGFFGNKMFLLLVLLDYHLEGKKP